MLTDYARAGRIVEVAKRLDFVRNVFLIGNEAVAGCTQFDELLKDAGDGKVPFIYILKKKNFIVFAIY